MSNVVCALIPPTGLCFHLGLSGEYCPPSALAAGFPLAILSLLLWHFDRCIKLHEYFLRAASLPHVLQRCGWLRFGMQNRPECGVIQQVWDEIVPLEVFLLAPCL